MTSMKMTSMLLLMMNGEIVIPRSTRVHNVEMNVENHVNLEETATVTNSCDKRRKYVTGRRH